MDERRTHILDLPDEFLLKISERVAMVKIEGRKEYPVEVGYFRLRHVCRRFQAAVKDKPHLDPLREGIFGLSLNRSMPTMKSGWKLGGGCARNGWPSEKLRGRRKIEA
jgi:hypothetical protein